MDRLAEDVPVVPQLFLQIKILPDPNKYGWQIPELFSHLTELEACKNVKLRGLMTILPLGLTSEQSLAAFQSTTNLLEQINQQSSLALTELSMGMSNDYGLAVKAGSTMIRLGQILFTE